MPTYEYKCEKCNYQFEEFQSMLDKPLKKCPKCKGKLNRLIGAGGGIIFKGGGWPGQDIARKTEEKENAKENIKTEERN